MVCLQNLSGLRDANVSLQERAVTTEDEATATFTLQEIIHKDDNVYFQISHAMNQMANHIKKNSNNAIYGGNFFFKTSASGSLVLLYATQIKS